MILTPNCTATWVQRTVSGQDAYGNETFTDSPVSVPAIFAPGGSTETVVGQDQVTDQPALYMPAPSPTPTDAVTVNGVSYEVDGLPQSWPASPFSGWQPDYPVVVKLKRTVG